MGERKRRDPGLDGAVAFRWRQGGLEPVVERDPVQLGDLLHIDRQKAALLANTGQFLAGRPANHALLTGARGTGKSALIKAVLNALAGDGLRLAEVAPHDLPQLHDIVRPLRGRRERFILYVDDFSLAAHDPALSALKATLDGDIEAPPANVLIYATSNRRHLLPEMKADNQEYRWIEGELHPGESTEEKISLSERFGLWLSFPPYTQEQFLQLVAHHLARFSVRMDEAAQAAALRWALQRASRNGRVAQQFARDWAGRYA